MITPAQLLGLQHVIELAKAAHNTVGSTFAQNPIVMESNAISMRHIRNAQAMLDMLSVTSGTDYFPSFPGSVFPDHDQTVLLYVPSLSHKFVLAKFIQDKSRICNGDAFEDASVWDEETQKHYWPEGYYLYIHDAVEDYCWHQLEGLVVERWWAVPQDMLPEHLAEPTFFYKVLGAEEFVDLDMLIDQFESDHEVLNPIEVQRQLNISLSLKPVHFVMFPVGELTQAHVHSFSDSHAAGEAIWEFQQENPKQV